MIEHLLVTIKGVLQLNSLLNFSLGKDSQQEQKLHLLHFAPRSMVQFLEKRG